MNGKKLKWVHAGFVFFWIAVWITATLTGWINSVAFVSHLSIIALILSSWSAWQAARTEQKEDEQ